MVTSSEWMFFGSINVTMLNSNFMPYNRYLWKIKVPLKVKIFLWFLYKGASLTKDNLVKRNWHGNEKCCFRNNLRLYNIYFLIVFLLSSFGE